MTTATYKCLKQKSLKVPFVIYRATESLIEKISACDNNLQEFYITKINKHTTWGYSLFTNCIFDSQKTNKPKKTNKQTWFLNR